MNEVNPPAIVRNYTQEINAILKQLTDIDTEQELRGLEANIKRGDYYRALKAICIEKGLPWLKFLADHSKHPPSSVNEWMRVSEHNNQIAGCKTTAEALERIRTISPQNSSTLTESVNGAPSQSQLCDRCERVGSVRDCAQCAELKKGHKAPSVRAPASSGASQRDDQSAPSREPGDDTPPLWPKIERCGQTLQRRLKDFGQQYQAPKPEVEGLLQSLARWLERFRRLLEVSNRKPPAPPCEGVCKYCGQPILWVSTEKGKRMPVDREPGGGSFELMNGVAVKVEWTKEDSHRLYRPHFLNCKRNHEKTAEA